MRKQSNKLFSFLNGIKWRDLRLSQEDFMNKHSELLESLLDDVIECKKRLEILEQKSIKELKRGDVKCEDFNALRSLVYLSVLELEETINPNKIPF
ncbi:hypothetical protein FNE05_06665 [Helicobacter pylori]|nr:hypothetical protein FNE05_06665 [Helicobacter pylori]